MSDNPDLLLKKARELDHQALTKIYDLYCDALFAYAYQQVGDSKIAEDLVSDTFTRLLNALEKGGGPTDHLRAYLYRITHNLITDRFRKNRPPSIELEEDKLADESSGPDQILADSESTNRVRDALMLITPEQRQVIVLKYLEGWSGPEIAQTMEKSLGAVKALQHRGLAALQRILLDDQALE